MQSGGTLTGTLLKDTVPVDASAATLAYDHVHFAGANSIIAASNSAFTIAATTDSVQSDCAFTFSALNDAAAMITARALTSTATIGGVVAKIYDATTAATGATVTVTVAGAIAGDTIGLNTSGMALAFTDSLVLNANNIAAKGIAAPSAGPTAANSVARDYPFVPPLVANRSARHPVVGFFGCRRTAFV